MAIIPLHGGEARPSVVIESADVTEGQFLRVTGITGTQLKARSAIATLGADGIAGEDAAVGEITTMIAPVAGTVMKVQAAAGVTAGDLVKPNADGKAVTATINTDANLIIGRALTNTSSGFIEILVR